MIVHLVDGTYELFRCYYGNKHSARPDDGRGAVRLVLHTLLGMVEEGATHIGVATDHVIESFRNALWPGYKTGEGIEPALLAQFHPLEEALAAFGFVVWPMVELEADDALASAAAAARIAPEVQKVCIWTPDKDLAQCVVGDRVVQVDRRGGHIRDEAAVQAKFGVLPGSIPDYLALVGDSADGYPGIPGWGAKSTAAVLSRYGHIADIPLDDVHGPGGRPAGRPPGAVSARLAQTLLANWEHALLFLDLATLRTDAGLFDSVDALRWEGPRPEAGRLAARIGAEPLLERARKAASGLQ
jgi:5'-3' exonuclease